ncbi:hypothetical protein ABLB84_04430 [Xenorhabdus szentirmaii]
MSQNAVTNAIATAKSPNASATQRGIVRLSDSRELHSSETAATSLAASHNYTDMRNMFGAIGNTDFIHGV